MEQTVSITWDMPILRKFRRVYAKAVAGKKTTFTFETHEFDINYAKFLLEYLEGYFGVK